MMELQYFKTDRNGTKYFYDYNCPRCGGLGWSSKWIYTGKTCYECGGTGKRMKPVIVKEYTPEYMAKLEAKRQAKANALREKSLADGYKAVMGDYGYNSDGIKFIYTGNTYAIKDDLKAHGAKWDNYFGIWSSKEKIGDYPCIEMSAEGMFYFDNNHGRYYEDVDKKDEFINFEHREEIRGRK